MFRLRWYYFPFFREFNVFSMENFKIFSFLDRYNCWRLALVSWETPTAKAGRCWEILPAVMEANEATRHTRRLEPRENDDGPSWYLPHFPIAREDKETTKVRRYGGVSLNDFMLPKPKLQQDVFNVLLRFRSNPVVLLADLTEMFSQFTMAKQERRYQRFLWRGANLSWSPEV